jgi:hypothetical protein
MNAKLITLSLIALSLPAAAHARPVMVQPNAAASYEQIVRNAANMVGNQLVAAMVGHKGLNLVNVMWEDTGRYQGSSVGPNISDVTIEVEVEGQHGRSNHLMPVIRYPNFSDKTADIDIDKFFVRVGNQKKDGRLRTVSLRELLRHPGRYMSLPKDGRIVDGSLLAKRDSHVLVSAQSAFLPVPQGGQARFYPVIFNYQSYQDNPAVLTILVTRQGASMTVIDNSRDTVSGGASWGQRLYFNAGGERAPLTAERLKDVQASGVTANGESAASLGKDANLLLLIQVPLKVKEQPMMALDDMEMAGAGYGVGSIAAKPAPPSARRTRGADMDTAVLGHGATEGKYTELAGLTIERDPRFPVRVTVQFYQATATGEIAQAHVDALSAQIDRVYDAGDYVGSLVVPDRKQKPRPTEWQGTSEAPAHLSWQDFPGLRERYQAYGALAMQRLLFRW